MRYRVTTLELVEAEVDYVVDADDPGTAVRRVEEEQVEAQAFHKDMENSRLIGVVSVVEERDVMWRNG